MSLRINNNITALNVHRQLVTNSKDLTRTIERLGSGMKINRAADAPASLIISEQLRSQVGGINQAIDNSETAVSMVQTTEAAMVELSSMLVRIRKLAIHAANEGANDDKMLAADQLELDNILQTIDRISRNAQFGKKKLLDGSTSANGVATGDGMAFISAEPDTKPSPTAGYRVRVFQPATQASIEGTQPMTQEIIDGNEELVLTEGGRTLKFLTKTGESVRSMVNRLRHELKANELDLDISLNEDDTLSVRHNKYGSEPTFSVSSSTNGVLSEQGNVIAVAESGKDIAGTIGGEVAKGEGQYLSGAVGTEAQGLTLFYNGNKVAEPNGGPDDDVAGRVFVAQNSLVFQVGPNVGQTTNISLVDAKTRLLGRGIENKSNFKSLHDVNLLTPQAAEDTQLLSDVALDSINSMRARIGAFQKNTLEANLRQLRVNAEELTRSESVIRDADMAYETIKFTRDTIMTQAATAMLAQANQVPRTVLSLLG